MTSKATEDSPITKVEDIEERFQRALLESPIVRACMYMYTGGELTLEQALKFMVVTLHVQSKSLIDTLVEINMRSLMSSTCKQLLKENNNAKE